MARRIADLHVTYHDATGWPRSESFDVEDELDVNEIIQEYITTGATNIVVTIETEEGD